MIESESEPRSESSLIASALAGDQFAYSFLYANHRPHIMAVLLRLTGGHRENAEDLLQETFMLAFRGLPRFRQGAKFSTWIHRIAVNTFFMSARYKKSLTHPDLPNFQISLEDPNYERYYLHVEDRNLESFPERDMIRRCLPHLPPQQRRVLMLQLEGWEHHEIGDILGCTVGTSKSQLSKAKAKVKKMVLSKKPVPRIPLPPPLASPPSPIS